MLRYLPKRVQRGFTLVELLIVVIIVSILAAIVIPQFASSTNDAKFAALTTNLSTLRSSVEMYYQQHGHYPSGAASSGGTPPAGGAAGTGAINTPQALIDQLTLYTNAAGQAATASDVNYKFGPYVKKGLPIESVSGIATVEVSAAGILGMTATGNAGGWKFDNKTGQLIANTTALQGR